MRDVFRFSLMIMKCSREYFFFPKTAKRLPSTIQYSILYTLAASNKTYKEIHNASNVTIYLHIAK